MNLPSSFSHCRPSVLKGAITAVLVLALPGSSRAGVTSNWKLSSGTANWSTSGDWSSTIPGSAGDIATDTGVTSIVTLDSARTVGQLECSASGKLWTIANSGSIALTLDNSGGSTNFFGDSNAFIGVNSTSASGSRALQINPNLIISNTDLDIGTGDAGLTIGASANSATITATTSQTINFKDNDSSSNNNLITINDSIGTSGANIAIVFNGTSSNSNSVDLAGSLGSSVTSITDTSPSTGTTIAGTITGAAGLTMNSAGGSLYMNDLNPSWTGTVTITAGRVAGGGATSLGTGAVSISSGGQFFSNTASSTTIANSFTLAGSGGTFSSDGSLGDGSIRLQNTTLSGTVTIPTAAAITVNSGDTATVTGQITGAGALTFYPVFGTGILLLDNTGASANNWSGGLTISGGNNRQMTLKLGAANQIPYGPGTGNVTISAGTSSVTLDLNGSNTTLNGLDSGASANNIVTNSGGSATLTLGASGSTALFGGVISDGGAGRMLSLVMTGMGSQTLSGTNTYSGTTTVNGGTLAVTGSLAAASAVTVNGGGTLVSNGTVNGPVMMSSGGTLTGAGTVNGPVTVGNGGLLTGAPGTGSLTLANAVALGANPGDTETVTVTASAISPTVPSINVTGSLTLNGNAGGVTLNVGGGGLTAGNTYALLNYAGAIGGNGYAGFNIGALPPRVLGSVVNAAGSIELNVTSVDFPVWTGAFGGNWAPSGTVTTGEPDNWVLNSNNATTTDFVQGDTALFNDLPGANTTVNISPANVSPGAVIFANNTYQYTVTGSGTFGITGPAAVTMNGASTVTLSTTNTYSGGTTINAGTLVANAAGALGTGPVLLNTGTLVINNASALGTGALFTINNGTIDNGSGGTLPLTSNNPQNWNGSLTFIGSNSMSFGSGAVALQSSVTVTVGANTLTVGGAIGDGSHGYGLTVAGGGTLALTANSTYSGGATINAGATLIVSSGGNGGTALGSGNTAVNPGGTLVGATADAFGYSPNAAPTAININGGTVTDLGTSDYRITLPNLVFTGGTLTSATGNSNVAGNGNYSFFGNGTAATITTNANSATAAISAGSVSAQEPTTFNVALGSVAGTATTPGVDLLISSIIVPNGSQPITKSGNGVLSLSGANTYTGATNITAGTVLISNGAAFGPTSAANGAVTIAAGATLDLSGITTALASPGFGPKVYNLAGAGVSGNGAIVNNSTNGSAVLHGFENVTLTGNATIGGSNAAFATNPNSGEGRIDIGRDATSSLNLAGFTLTKAGSNLLNLATDLTVQAGNIVASGGVLSFDTGAKFQNPATSNLIMEGGTILQFFNSATGNVTAPIFFNGANIQVGQTDGSTMSTINSPLSANENVLFNDQNGVTQAAAGLNLTGVFSDVSAAQSAALASNSSLPAVAAGAGSVTKSGNATITLSGANTYSGGTTVNSGILKAGSGSAFGAATGSLTVNGGTLDLGGNTITAGAFSGTGGTVTTSAGTASLTVGDGTPSVTYSGTISGNLNFTKQGSGSLLLAGANAYTGGTAINGGTLQINTDSSLGMDDGTPATGATINNGTLEAVGNVTSTRNYVLGNAASTIQVDGGMTFAINNSATGNVSGSGALNATGPGILVLNDQANPNSYSGGSVLGGGGTVRISTNTSLGSGPATINNATLEATAVFVTGRSFQIGSASSTIAVDAGTYEIDGTINDVSGNPGTLNVNGPGTLAITGTNGYSGGTAIQSGTLQVGNNGTAGTLGPGTVIDDANLAFDRSSTYTVANNISGTGVVTNSGSGTLYLTGTNTYSGGTAINAGIVNAGSNANLGSGPISFGGGTLQFAAAFDPTASGAVTINAGGGTFDTNGNTITAAGAINGTGSLTVIGSGSVSLTGSNAYSGGTVINTATVNAGSNANLGSGPISIGGNGTLQFAAAFDPTASGRAVTLNSGIGILDTQGNNVTVAGAINGTGTLVKIGSGTLSLNGPQNYPTLYALAGTTNLNGALGGGASTLNAYATTNVGASQNLAGLNVGPSVTLAITAHAPLMPASGSTIVVSNTFSTDGGFTAPTPTIDLTNNAMVIMASTGVTLSQVESLIASGANFSSGYFNGPGITSSNAANDPNGYTAVGYADNSQLGYTSINGTTFGYATSGPGTGIIDGTNADILVKYTYFGDTDLNGTVDVNDYNDFLGGYLGFAPATWLNGDFDYNGTVDINDYNDFLAGLAGYDANGMQGEIAEGGQTGPASLSAPASVPEPGSFGLLAAGALGALIRRRKSGRISSAGDRNLI